MSQFQAFFLEGKNHILDYHFGYDHILFVVALCALYLIRDWKKVLILVTAFTIAHSLTLALVALDVIRVSEKLVEFLIPVTIFITAVSNLFTTEDSIHDKRMQVNYTYALVFGLIHGLGFSNYFRAILGRDSSIISQLFAFNLGIELGQIIIVAIFLVAGFILVELIGVSRRDWKMVISSAVAGIAIILIKDKWYWAD